MISDIELKRRLKYNPESGEFVWVSGPRKGKIAGWLHDKGHSKKYWRIEISGKCYYRSRLAWVYVYGVQPDTIDHINGNQLDDRICNLRSVSQHENMKNVSLHSSNTSKVCGVYFERVCMKWRSQVFIEGKKISLGVYEDWFDAVCARMSANNKYNFHQNHGRQL